MRKMIVRISICGIIATFCLSYFLVKERQMLREGLIRFHVVANSDSAEDQKIKYSIRDAVLQSLLPEMKKIKDVKEARDYLQENLPKIQLLVTETLESLGFYGQSSVSLCKERFDIRNYDTFSLPAGVYDSLRIVIGEGQGKNWWCVSFPQLCMPATTSGFEDAAVSAGFSTSLAQTLSNQEPYDIHFYFLNQLGKLENIFFREEN